MFPKVSIVIPVFNRSPVIGPCIDSVLASDYPSDRLEVVVVDNGSTDGTLDILKNYQPRIVLTEEARRGPAAARNAGCRLARGEVVAFTDSDCVVAPDWLTRLMEGLADSEATAVGGRILAFPDGNNVEHFGERIHDHRKALTYFEPPYAITMNLALPLSVLRDLGGFNEALARCSDVEFGYRLGRAGHRFTYAHEAVIFHRNQSSLFGLISEGFTHGYHGATLSKLERQRVRAGLVDPHVPRDSQAPEPPGEYTRQLAPFEEALYRFCFNGAKRVGRTASQGRLGRRRVGV